MISVLEALYEESTGGVDVFDVSSPLKSDDRIAALQWLVEEDPLQVPIPSRSVGDTIADFDDKAYKLRQRYVVVLMYMATNGQDWGEQHNFLSGNDECKWNSNFVQDGSESVDNKFNVQGLICNDNGKVTKIPMCKWSRVSRVLCSFLPSFGIDNPQNPNAQTVSSFVRLTKSSFSFHVLRFHST